MAETRDGARIQAIVGLTRTHVFTGFQQVRIGIVCRLYVHVLTSQPVGVINVLSCQRRKRGRMFPSACVVVP